MMAEPISGGRLARDLNKAIPENLSMRGEYSCSGGGRKSGNAFRQTSNGRTCDIDGEYGIDIRRHDFRAGLSCGF